MAGAAGLGMGDRRLILPRVQHLGSIPTRSVFVRRPTHPSSHDRLRVAIPVLLSTLHLPRYHSARDDLENNISADSLLCGYLTYC